MLRFLIMFMLSGMIIADDHKIPESFEDCEGRIANYYVAKLTPRGSLEGWYKATEMHREYYQSRGGKVNIYPSLQYRVDEENNTEDKIFRVSSLVVWDSQKHGMNFVNFETIEAKTRLKRTEKNTMHL